MRKLFYLLFIITFSQCTSNGYMQLQPQYEQEQIGLVPDYSQLVYWAAHPDKRDPSDSLPKPLKKDFQASRQPYFLRINIGLSGYPDSLEALSS